MTVAAKPFDYSNLSGRQRGPFLQALGVVVPGIRRVQQQIVPYAAQWQRANLAALQQDGPLWVALGDSMTQGIGASAYDRGWVGQLAGRLADAGRPHRLVNLAMSGARVEDVLDKQLPALRSLPAPALVTVLIGSNDMLRKVYREAVPQRYAELLAQLPEGSVVANLPNGNGPGLAVNRLVDVAARDGRIVVADMRSPRTGSWKGKLAEDHFHPNDAGYAGLADVFAAALRLPAAVSG